MAVELQATVSKIRGSSLARVLLLIVGLGLLAFMLTAQLLRPPVPDESTYLYGSWLTSMGKLPYRDFFDFTGPGTFFLTGLFIKLFGFTLLGLRLLALLMLATCGWLTWRMTRFFLESPWYLAITLFMVFIPMGITIVHHTYSMTAGVMGAYCLFRYVELEGLDRRRLMASGLLLGLSAMFTQSLGGLLGLFGLGFLLLYRRFRHGDSFRAAMGLAAACFVLPALLPAVLTVLYYWSQGALHDLFYCTFGWLLEGHYGKTTSHFYMVDAFTPFRNFVLTLLQTPSRLGATLAVNWFYYLCLFVQGGLPVLGLLWAGQILKDRFPRDGFRLRWSALSQAQWQFLCVLSLALAFFLASFSYPSSVLVSLHGWLLFALGCGAARNLAAGRPLWGRLVAAFFILILAGRVLQTSLESWRAYIFPPIVSYGTVEKRLTAIGYPTRASVSATDALIRYLHDMSPPGESLFVYNLSTELYILADRRNPTRYPITMALYNSPAQLAESYSDLNRKRPVFIVYDRLDQTEFATDWRFKNYRHYDYSLQGINRLLEKDYVLAGQMQNMLIFQRWDTLPPAARSGTNPP